VNVKQSGELIVVRTKTGMLRMDFPQGVPKKVALSAETLLQLAAAMNLG